MPSHLAIEIGNDYFKLSEISDGRVGLQNNFVIEGRNASEKKQSLEDNYRKSGISEKPFDEVTLSWSSKESTLIPASIFSDSKPEDIYKLCFGSLKDESEVDYNRIAELSIVNVYRIGDWIKSFFVLKYPRVIIQHTGTHLVRNMLDNNAFYLKGSLIVFRDHFLLALVKHNNLEFYSFFDHMNAEDVIYHLSFALQQKEMNDEKGTIELIPSGEADANLIAEIKEKASGLSNLSGLKFEVVNDYIAKSQLLCV